MQGCCQGRRGATESCNRSRRTNRITKKEEQKQPADRAIKCRQRQRELELAAAEVKAWEIESRLVISEALACPCCEMLLPEKGFPE